MTKYSVDRFLRACGGLQPIQLRVESSDDYSCSVFCFQQPYILLGHHECADIRLSNSEISQRQMYLQLIGGRLYCIALSQRVPTRWNGEIRPAGWIDFDDKITFGPFKLRLLAGVAASDEGNPPPPDMAGTGSHNPRISLELQRKTEAPLRGVLDRDMVLIGHHRLCRIQIADPNLSSIHCSLVRTGGELWAVDLCGKGGIQVNGVASRNILLEDGDRLELGGRSLRIRHESTAATNADVLAPSRSSNPVAAAVVASVDEPRPDTGLGPAIHTSADVAIPEE